PLISWLLALPSLSCAVTSDSAHKVFIGKQNNLTKSIYSAAGLAERARDQRMTIGEWVREEEEEPRRRSRRRRSWTCSCGTSRPAVASAAFARRDSSSP